MFDTGGVPASPSPFLHHADAGSGHGPDVVDGTAPGVISGEDQRSTLRRLSELIRPVTLAAERRLPVDESLTALLPDGALERGSVLRITGVGATSLALALVAAASQQGSWSAVIGLPELALVAADEHGVALGRLALIEVPGWRRCAEVVAALIDGMDFVLLDGRAELRAVEIRRVTARMREQGSVLLLVDPGLSRVPSVPISRSMSQAVLSRSAEHWSPDVVLRLGSPQWSGVGQGHGLLRQRRVVIDAVGRGRSARPRHLEVLLPDHHGSVASTSSDAPSLLGRGHRVAG